MSTGVHMPVMYQRSFTSRTARWMAPTYSAYSGISGRDGSSRASMVTRPRHSGCWDRNRSKAREAAHDVLGGVGAVHPQDHLLGPGLSTTDASCSRTSSEAASRSNSAGSTEIG